MAVTVSTLFVPAQLAAAVAVIYTVPTNPTTNVLSRGRVRFSNTDNAAHTITAYAVPPSGTASASNEFMPGESLAGNSHIDIDVPLLGSGGTIQAFADTANKVTILALDGILFS